MLNAGLLGGSRADAVDFAHRMVSVADDLFSSRFWKKETAPVEIGDMAAFNLVAYTYFKDRIVTGPLVHSVFKANERSPYAWWRHK